MKTPKLIENALASLYEAIDELNAKRNELWAASDAAKAAGDDWVPANHAGNSVDAAAAVLKTYVDGLKTNISYIPRMIEKHKLN